MLRRWESMWSRRMETPHGWIQLWRSIGRALEGGRKPQGCSLWKCSNEILLKGLLVWSVPDCAGCDINADLGIHAAKFHSKKLITRRMSASLNCEIGIKFGAVHSKVHFCVFATTQNKFENAFLFVPSGTVCMRPPKRERDTTTDPSKRLEKEEGGRDVSWCLPSVSVEAKTG